MTSKRNSDGEAGQDAIELLTSDHKKVKSLFKAFEKAKEDDEQKSQLVEQICQELKVHARIEEEIFYPAVREALDDEEMIDHLDEAEVEHASAKELIAQIEEMDSGDELYDAKVTVLGEYVEHHIKEEESQIFPQVKKAKLDVEDLGMQMSERKSELESNPEMLDAVMPAKRSRGGKGLHASK